MMHIQCIEDDDKFGRDHGLVSHVVSTEAL